MRVLFAHDGSPYSLGAARFLSTWITPDATVDVNLVTVVPQASDSSHRGGGGLGREGKRSRGTRENRLRETEGQLRALGLTVRRRTLHGEPQETLVREAAGHDLVVAGVKGQNASPFFELGSVALALLRHAKSSILLVRERRNQVRQRTTTDEDASLRVLLCTDGDATTLSVAQRQLDSLALHDVELEVITVVPKEPLQPGQPRRVPWHEGPRTEVHARARRWLHGAVRANASPPVTSPGPRLLSGRPAPEIERRAEECRADLIVVGARGNGHRGVSTLGSTAREVVWRAPCSVLVVRNEAALTPRAASDGPGTIMENGEQTPLSHTDHA